MRALGWPQIVRLGLAQTALGAIVVLTTSIINRVMVVELAMPALLPGALVGLHYAVQFARPRWGYESDLGGRRTPWIVGGIGVLGLGAVLAAAATAWMATSHLGGICLAVFAYLLIGAGVGAAGTSLLAMLAANVDPGRRAAAASLVWLMMIAGFILTTASAGHFLEPFTVVRLVQVTAVVSLAAFLLCLLAVIGIELEGAAPAERAAAEAGAKPPFSAVIAEIWAEPRARAFTIFVFVSMLAYSTQDLILEPFAGQVFGMSPAATTQLSAGQHAGTLTGMLAVAFFCSGKNGPRFGSVRAWTASGCLASGLVLCALAVGGFLGPTWPIKQMVFVLGVANGSFAVAAIGWMMTLAGAGQKSREGVRMGLWGGAQAIAFALGGLFGTGGVDLVRTQTRSLTTPYAAVFAVESLMFVAAAWLALRMDRLPDVDKELETPHVGSLDLHLGS